MSHTSTTITAPVTTTDVATVLAVASHNVGYLCSNQHGKINKWARFKPERNATIGPLGLIARKSNNFGLSAAKLYGSRNAFLTDCRQGSVNVGWNYNPPLGGETMPFRLGDFNGYKHDATPPFGNLNPFTGYLVSDQTAVTVIPCAQPPDDEGCINIADMQNGNYNYSEWYLGVLIYTSSRYFMATMQQPIGTAQDWQVELGWINPAYAGEYIGVPFLANKKFTATGSEPQELRIVGIGNAGVKVTLIQASDIYTPTGNCMFADWVSDKVIWTAMLRNPTSTAKTFTQVVLEVAKSDTGANATTLMNFGTVAVAAGKTWVQTGETTLDRSYQFCRLRYNGSSNGWINFEDPDVDAGDIAQ